MEDPTQSTSHDSPDPSSRTWEEPSPGRTAPSSTGGQDEVQLALDVAKTWVQEHQTAAMLGAFALGAFIGALMRD